jgi:endonuclease YncB( thermonuclease family)
MGRKGIKHTLLVLLFLVSQPAVADKPFPAPVLRVVDGDTVKIEMTVRIPALDCPEKKQPGGPEALEELARLIEKQRVIVDIQGRDLYGRFLANLTDEDGNDVASHMIGDGWCWVYYRVKDEELRELQKEAKDEKRGLWGGEKEPEAPWEWRKRQKAAAKAKKKKKNVSARDEI